MTNLAEIRAELNRELTARRRTYPDRIARARMSEAEAERELALVEALLADLERMVPPRRAYAETHDFTWGERRQCLVRELAMRRRLYPEWIDRQRLDQATATRRITLLEQLLAIYDDGFDWRGRNGQRPIFARDEGPENRRACGELYAHFAAVDHARGNASMARHWAEAAAAYGIDVPALANQQELAL